MSCGNEIVKMWLEFIPLITLGWRIVYMEKVMMLMECGVMKVMMLILMVLLTTMATRQTIGIFIHQGQAARSQSHKAKNIQ